MRSGTRPCHVTEWKPQTKASEAGVGRKTGTYDMTWFSRLRGRLPPISIHGIQLLGGTTISQFIPAIVSPILTHLYTPTDFGVFALTYGILVVASAVACLRYELAIVLPPNHKEALQVIAACMGICVGMVVLSALLCLAFWAWSPSRSAAGLAVPLMAMVPVGILLMGLQAVAQLWCVRVLKFGVISTALLFQATMTAAVQVGLGAIWGSNPYFLIIGMQVGLFFSLTVFAHLLLSTILPLLRQELSAFGIRDALKRYVRFPIYAAPYVFATQVASRLTLLILAGFATTSSVGQFALAQRVIYLPVPIILGTASQIFFSRAARCMDDPRLPIFVRRAVLAATLMFGPLFVFGFLFAEPVFRTLFGRNWTEAGRFAAVLAGPSMLITLTSWLDRIYDIIGRQRLALILQISNDSISLTLMLAVLYFTHDPLLAVTAFAVSVSIYCIVWTYFTFSIGGFGTKLLLEYVSVAAAVVAFVLVSNSVISQFVTSYVIRFLLLTAICIPVMGVGAWIGLLPVRLTPT
jgi:O-antigen/teichoic acid export membrane protein